MNAAVRTFCGQPRGLGFIVFTKTWERFSCGRLLGDRWLDQRLVVHEPARIEGRRR